MRILLNKSLFTTILESFYWLYQPPMFPMTQGKSVSLPRSRVPCLRCSAKSLVSEKPTYPRSGAGWLYVFVMQIADYLEIISLYF